MHVVVGEREPNLFTVKMYRNKHNARNKGTKIHSNTHSPEGSTECVGWLDGSVHETLPESPTNPIHSTKTLPRERCHTMHYLLTKEGHNFSMLHRHIEPKARQHQFPTIKFATVREPLHNTLGILPVVVWFAISCPA